MQNGFGSETEYDGNGTGNSVAIADLNGDGLPDLVIANSDVLQQEYGPNPGDVTVLMNQGNGVFAPGVTYALPAGDQGYYPGGPSGSPYDVTTADLFGDGRQDIILSNKNGTVTILPNEGDGTFGTPVLVDASNTSDGTDITQVVTADVNGDGLPDLLVGGGAAGSPYGIKDDNGISLSLNNGHGGFDAPVAYDLGGSFGEGYSGSLVTGFTTADVNGDHRPDLIALSDGGTDFFSVSLNDGAGGVGAPTAVDIPQPATGPGYVADAIAAGDLNGDGAPDVVVSLSGSGAAPSGVDVFLNDGHGGYGAPVFVPLTAGFTPGGTVTLGDVNGDGRLDIIVGGDDIKSPDQTEIVLNEGDGVFSAPTLYGGLAASAAGDLNGDGKLDLVGSGYFHAMPAGDSESVVVALQGPNEPAVCYAAGTRILTRQGEVAVEALREGDEVMTLLGQGFAAVAWLGHHRMNLKAHPDPRAVQPVRILAGAFGPGRPARDLRVSPGHALYVDGVLIQAERLVNGATIRREADCEAVVYWHVELDRHDVILAEGMPAESYLDTGNRTAFVGGGDFVQLHPDFAPRHWAETCAPMVHEGASLEAAKARLLRRAQDAFGWQVSREPGLHLLADGAAIAGAVSERVHRFALPAGCRELRLVSRRWVPAEMLSGSTDMRVLGVCVRRLVLDGRELALDDAALSDGWDKPERDDHGAQRWTTGSAVLPPGARNLVVELDGLFAAWSDPEPARSARSA